MPSVLSPRPVLTPTFASPFLSNNGINNNTHKKRSHQSTWSSGAGGQRSNNTTKADRRIKSIELPMKRYRRSTSPCLTPQTQGSRVSLASSMTNGFSRLSQETQEFPYKKESSACEEALDLYFLYDDHADRSYCLSTKGKQNTCHSSVEVKFSIGRSKSNDLCIEEKQVSRYHAHLIINLKEKSFQLVPESNKSCHILEGSEWTEIKQPVCLYPNSTFRLVPYTKEYQYKDGGVQFTLIQGTKHPSNNVVGPTSFDIQKQELMGKIANEGVVQHNKKGGNKTLPDPFRFTIDLRTETGDVVPLTTLRYINPQSAIVEALWYLRGESHVDFLRRNGINFWDKQATSEGFIGLNYGLLVNYPNGRNNGEKPYNQLDQKVIQPLCHGRTSRNMVCSLSKPDEQTLQEACTESVQFSVHQRNCLEYLDLTVKQRSSDVIVGLPHDVVVWSIILHLVRREVKIRSTRQLKAGYLYFEIAAGGAHIYQINERATRTLRKRTPIPGILPCLSVHTNDGMFDLAQTYQQEKNNTFSVKGYDKDKIHKSMKLNQAS